MDNITEKNLRSTLKLHARALNVPAGAAESFIEEVIKSTKVQLKSKKIITNNDLTRIVTKELKKYHADLAYVYQNYDKII